MPKIYVIGSPLDLYRYKTFINAIIDNKEDWGMSINYSPKNLLQKTQNVFIRKFKSLLELSHNLFYITKADYIYFPPMVLGYSISSRLIKTYCDLLHKKVIFDFYISLYDTLVLDRKKYAEGSKEAIKLKEIDNWGHTRWLTIYLNRCEAKRYRSLNNLEIDKNIRIVPLSIDSRPFAKLNYYMSNSSEIFNVVWWGTYIPLHGLDRIIKAIDLVRQKDKNIHLYILGNSQELSVEYELLVKDLALDEFVSISNDITFSNGKMLPFLIDKCDLAFGAFGVSDKAKSVILNKAIEAVSMKIPLLTQHSEAFEEYFEDNSTIFYCNNDPANIADKLMEIKSINHAQLEIRLDNSYEIYQNNFSIAASTKMFYNILNELANK